MYKKIFLGQNFWLECIFHIIFLFLINVFVNLVNTYSSGRQSNTSEGSLKLPWMAVLESSRDFVRRDVYGSNELNLMVKGIWIWVPSRDAYLGINDRGFIFHDQVNIRNNNKSLYTQYNPIIRSWFFYSPYF